MTDDTALVERLRKEGRKGTLGRLGLPICKEAADALEAAQTREAKLREANGIFRGCLIFYESQAIGGSARVALKRGNEILKETTP